MSAKTFRVTVQYASVIERSYDIEATDADDAIDVFYEEHAATVLTPVHEETIRSNFEVVGTEEMG